jgi:hypothetical protein
MVLTVDPAKRTVICLGDEHQLKMLSVIDAPSITEMIDIIKNHQPELVAIEKHFIVRYPKPGEDEGKYLASLQYFISLHEKVISWCNACEITQVPYITLEPQRWRKFCGIRAVLKRDIAKQEALKVATSKYQHQNLDIETADAVCILIAVLEMKSKSLLENI